MGQFEVDCKRFISDLLDSETIVMDTISGRLFLLEQGATVLWECIGGGWTREALIAEVEERYGASERASTEMFLERLSGLGLITEIDMPSSSPALGVSVSWPLALGELMLTQYDDMTSIITMDPIHDVDPDRGWPFNSRG